LEANAAGRPVIAYGAGGACDSVRNGETGQLFVSQTVDALAAVLERFRGKDYDPRHMRAHALAYGTDVFKRRIARFVEFARQHGPEPASDQAWLPEWRAGDAVTMQEVRHQIRGDLSLRANEQA
jgi:hypothetical protein